MRRVRISLLMLCLPASLALAGEPLRNWFNDPYFALSAEQPGCPVPAGPYMTEAERTAESHSRIERGTTCWMTGNCKEPNAYLYDARIAQAVRERVATHPALRGTSLWVMVKRRFVWLQGCVQDMQQGKALEQALQELPDVERVLVDVMPGTAGRPPYRLMNAD